MPSADDHATGGANTGAVMYEVTLWRVGRFPQIGWVTPEFERALYEAGDPAALVEGDEGGRLPTEQQQAYIGLSVDRTLSSKNVDRALSSQSADRALSSNSVDGTPSNTGLDRALSSKSLNRRSITGTDSAPVAV
eukprot:gene17296-1021_t